MSCDTQHVRPLLGWARPALLQPRLMALAPPGLLGTESFPPPHPSLPPPVLPSWPPFLPAILTPFLAFFFFFKGHTPWHMEVLRLGVKSGLQLPAYTTATAMQDP